MFTHVDSNNKPTMVDVNNKKNSFRYAKARSVVKASESIMDCLKDGDIQTKKGPVFHTAIVAGTMAVKKTSELIPFCHPIPIDSCKINIHVSEANEIIIECEVKTFYKTGVEMEALSGVSIAALTIYDMCKALSHEICVSQTYLLQKSGGKNEYVKKK